MIDKATSTAITSLNEAMEYASHRLVSLEDPWSISVKMNGVEEADFQSVLSVGANSWIKTYFTGLTNSTTYGIVFIYFLVQFRGSK